MNMKISETGIKLITSFEGLRLRAYDDGVGVWTIGYGHTQGVQPGDVITEGEAENLLQDDLDDFERCVNQAVTVPISQHQFDALVSFTFNVGCGALRRSTLLRNLNAGGYPVTAIADQFLRWNRGGGRVLRGLTRRREAERALFLSEPSTEHAGTICSDEPYYAIGDRGYCVELIQKALSSWSAVAMLNPIAVDGRFGPKTKSRLQRFQMSRGLDNDGIVGPVTWNALEPWI